MPVSGGVCRGHILLLRTATDAIPSYTVTADEFPRELQRLEKALIATRLQIMEVQRKFADGIGAKDASIFDAHLLVLEDPTLMDEVTRVMKDDHINVEQAFDQVARKYAEALGAMEDEFLRERAADMRDVTSRILNNLLNRAGTGPQQLSDPCIVISHDLTPSTTAMLDRKRVLGFATDVGGRTSHTAIIARSLQIPAVVGMRDASHTLETGQYALLDGYNGLLIVNPTDQTLFEYGQLVQKHVNLQEKLRDIMDNPAVTLDGSRIVLSANIEQAGDVAAVKAAGAEGVGLFRTEFLFLHRATLPSEEEQFQSYHQAADALKPQPVIIRTLDLGGDKVLPHMSTPTEINPFLGWRAIRMCLHERDLFRTQLRAILRASVAGNVKIMYPMISGVEELVQANALLEEVKAELASSNIPFDRNLEVGVMIEIPSAVMIADALARRVRFFSIGTNDLIQYSLAVDRLNEKIAHLYEPTHPAILKLLKISIDAAHRQNIWAGVCGEIAGDVAMIPLLLGLGIDELSVAPPFVPEVKFLIRRLKMSEAKALADFALGCESGAEILEKSAALAREVAPSLFENR